VVHTFIVILFLTQVTFNSKFGCTSVTLEGDILKAAGTMTGGSQRYPIVLIFCIMKCLYLTILFVELCIGCFCNFPIV